MCASIDDLITSIRANCDGFVTVLEAGRRHGPAHLVYASSAICGATSPMSTTSVEGVIGTLDRPAAPNPAWNAEAPENSSSYAPYRVYNIGNKKSVKLLEFVETLEKIIGKPAIRELLPMQAGDVLETRADISALQRDVGFALSTPIAEGLARFVEWCRSYHGV
ncbi:hypothetical protein RAD16_24230 [Bradyrhizobium sp. 18BD]